MTNKKTITITVIVENSTDNAADIKIKVLAQREDDKSPRLVADQERVVDNPLIIQTVQVFLQAALDLVGESSD